MDQYLQAVLDRDAIRRSQGQRSRPREGARWYPRLDGAKVSLCRHQRRAASVGGVIHVQKLAEPVMDQRTSGTMIEAQSQNTSSVLLDVRLRRISWEAEGVM